VGLPTAPAEIGLGGLRADDLLALMQRDKKVQGGRISLILARDIGEAFICRDVAGEALADFLAAALAQGRNSPPIA
jgi:3-dehydroquinate synthase